MTSPKPAPPSMLETLQSGVLVFDGAMGTQLYERGVLFSACYEELNLTRAELVSKVHSEYMLSGATVLETNTFGANAMRLEKHGLSARVTVINEAAVAIARAASRREPGVAGDHDAYVAGCMGPSGYFLGEATPADLSKVGFALAEQAKALVGAGADAILLETFRQTNELHVAVEAALRAADGKIPVLACASLDEQLRMSDGTDAAAIAELIRSWGAQGAGVNCTDGPMNVFTACEAMRAAGLPLLALPNAGLPRRVDDRLVYVSTPEYFGVYARRMFKIGVRGVGGCCGTTPEHIKRVASAAKMAGSGASADAELLEASGPIEITSRYPQTPVGALPPIPFAERTSLSAKIAAGKFVTSVEVNPPVGLDPTKAILAAKMLKAGGIDVVNIADGARAQARMANIAMAVRIQREAEMETILHVCGRDRNLLATLAHFLGAHDLGVSNVVVITGDPPKMGDFPDASSVYDLDSIGMLKLVSRLNVGIDPGGKPLGGVTRFVVATGAEPAALNYEREIERLRLKKEAGAEIVMTQPVYDPRVLEKFLEDIAPLRMPVLVGLLPLASHRNAEFLHNEVPGMQIPEAVRERMRKVGSGPLARKEGVTIAREMLEAVRGKVQGAYIMPPLEKYELALEVVDGFLDADVARVAP